VWHHHPEFEITLVKRGGTERWVGDKLTPLKPGDLVLLGSDLPHDYRNDRGTTRRATKVEAIVVQFMPHLLGADWLRHASMKPVQQLFHRARLGLEIRGATRQRATQRLTQIAKAKGLSRGNRFRFLRPHRHRRRSYRGASHRTHLCARARYDDGPERERLQPPVQELHPPHRAAVCE
jgi:hypothetical protein